MKTNFILTVFLFAFVATVSGQEKPKSCNHLGRGKSCTISKDYSIEIWYENVSFDAANINIDNADSLRWDNKTNKLIAYNCKSYTFKGQKVIADKTNNLKQVEYTLGDNQVYIK